MRSGLSKPTVQKSFPRVRYGRFIDKALSMLTPITPQVSVEPLKSPLDNSQTFKFIRILED